MIGRQFHGIPESQARKPAYPHDISGSIGTEGRARSAPLPPAAPRRCAAPGPAPGICAGQPGEEPHSLLSGFTPMTDHG